MPRSGGRERPVSARVETPAPRWPQPRQREADTLASHLHRHLTLESHSAYGCGGPSGAASLEEVP